MLPIHYGLNYDLAVVKPLEKPGAQIEAINFQAERCAKNKGAKNSNGIARKSVCGLGE
jgi:hypothetical protein